MFKIKTERQLRKEFWKFMKASFPELAKEYKRNKRQNEYCADIRCMFVDFVDYLARHRFITQELANDVTL